jgi:hypothetical protein
MGAEAVVPLAEVAVLAAALAAAVAEVEATVVALDLRLQAVAKVMEAALAAVI